MKGPFDADTVQQYEHQTWSRCADGYLDHFAGLTGETVPLIREAARIRSGSKVLEIGSGPGHVAGALAGEGAKVTGIDFSAKMVEIAERQYPNVAFREADAEKLPFDDETFDAVIANFVVHHLARPDLVFREVCRVLKPGGRFAFAVFGRPEAQSSIHAFFNAFAAHHNPDELPHGPLFGAPQEAYPPLMDGSGLCDLNFETRDIIWRCNSVEPVLTAFLEWGNVATLPQDAQEKIAASARENLEAYRDGGGYAFPHTALVGSATKPTC